MDFVSIGVGDRGGLLGTGCAPAGRYRYDVIAQDTSYNSSEPSNVVAAAAESREVAVTFDVHVPDYTPAGDTIYIAGDFQGWDPGATPMERVDATTWTIPSPSREGDAPQYKFTRGSWDAVEKDAGCGEIPNRTATIVYGTDGTQDAGRTRSRSGVTSTSAADGGRRM